MQTVLGFWNRMLSMVAATEGTVQARPPVNTYTKPWRSKLKARRLRKIAKASRRRNRAA